MFIRKPEDRRDEWQTAYIDLAEDLSLHLPISPTPEALAPLSDLCRPLYSCAHTTKYTYKYD